MIICSLIALDTFDIKGYNWNGLETYMVSILNYAMQPEVGRFVVVVTPGDGATP